MKLGNVFGTTFKGQIGKKVIAGEWKGHEYLRAYKKARVTKTERQMKQRGRFSEAIKAWGGLSGRQQEFYNKVAVGMTGCNLYVQRYLAALKSKLAPEFPIPMSWTTEDGKPVSEGALLVMQRERSIFYDTLEDAKGDVALTPADTPYTFVLMKGDDQDAVLTIKDLLDTDVPFTLESKKLGIKLIADVLKPPMEPTPRAI